MTRAPLDPPRLGDSPADGTGVARLVQSARQLPEPSPGAAQLLAWRIRNTLRQQRHVRQRRLRLALVALLLTTGSGVIGAAVLRYGLALRARGAASSATPAAAPSSVAMARSSRRPPPSPPPAPIEEPPPQPQPLPPSVTPAAPPPVAVANRRRQWRRPPEPRPPQEAPPAVEVSSPPTTPPTSTPAGPPPPLTEHALLSRAVRQLRVDGDATATLASLDGYAARFPLGVLRPEAAELRTEALLALGRKAEALRELDALLATPTPRSAEHHLLRGELRSAGGRWSGAVEDFDVVLRSDGIDVQSPRLIERALWGRATARSHLGTGPGADRGARADLSEYLRRFPDGRFAREAARLLGSSGP